MMATSAENLRRVWNGEIERAVVLQTSDKNDSPAAEGLREAGVEVSACRDALDAFSQAALFDRLDAVRSGWGLRPPGTILLVLEWPSGRDELRELALAAERYLRNVRIIRYEPGNEDTSPWRDLEGQPLRPTEPEAADSELTRQPSSFADMASMTSRLVRRSQQPRLRLVDSGEDAGALTSSTDLHRSPSSDLSTDEDDLETLDDARDARRLVTNDELAMLLRNDDEVEDDSSDRERAS